jgi:transposase
MEIVVERCAGLDVHKDSVVACVRVPGPSGERETKIASFSTFTEDLLALHDWLVALGVTRVGMEATGVYWKPVLYLLEGPRLLALERPPHAQRAGPQDRRR